MLKFFELAPSPNNTKVRMALRYKGIDFEATPVDPRDRSAVVAASGQELTPVIEDRGFVLNDSEAILQYLDASYRGTPRLFPADRAGRKQCDAFKRELDERLADSWAPVFFHGIGFEKELDEAARGRFEELLHEWEERLGTEESFGSPGAAICDLRVAEFATYALPGDGLIARVRLFHRFRTHFGVEPGSLPRLERFLEPWNERLA
ncbi:MAG: glutathione S-transferase [Acidobacteriota bacterium]|nr:glutathione S-transferase [Acidobacteriota bacterium]